MQLKLYKKSTIILTVILLLNAAGIVFLATHKQLWNDNKVVTMIIFAVISLALLAGYSFYDMTADRNIIRKALMNGDVAMAKIKGGTFVRFGRDARLKNHVYWKLDAEVYDNDMNKFDASIIEKFSTHQTRIPSGYVFVTYKDGHPDDCLIIPNMFISSIEEYRPLVEDYEKALKPKYLNAYSRNGLILQSYDDSLKQKKAETE